MVYIKRRMNMKVPPTKRLMYWLVGVVAACSMIVLHLHNSATFLLNTHEMTEISEVRLLLQVSPMLKGGLEITNGNSHLPSKVASSRSDGSVLSGAVSSKSEHDLERLRSLSSVDYISCCGLGHRLTKNSDAFYVSKLLGFSLRVHWGFCNATEVSHYLFGPQAPEQLEHITSTRQTLRLHNEVQGFRKLVRDPTKECTCSTDKFLSDIEYYESLRNRFRHRKSVQRFVDDKFDGHTVFGVHIRAGNNETGNFVKKHRGIDNVEEWVQNMVTQLKKLAKDTPKPPLVYLATDTASLIPLITAALEGIMPVETLAQDRPVDGVQFGSVGAVQTEGDTCLDGWKNTVMDMVLLSHADIVIAARPSSFVQSMPMILSLANDKESSFCEFSFDATDVRCFSSFQQWCCESDAPFFYGDMNQRYDYLRVPDDVENYNWTFRERPRGCQPRPGVKPTCLSYDRPAETIFLEPDTQAILEQ